MYADHAAADLVGTTIASKYRLLALLGAGGMGAVYEAEHVFTKRHVALKRMLPSLSRSKQAADRFIREAQAPSKIGHPGIVQVLDGGVEPDGSLYLVLELLEGISLQDALDEGPLQAAAVTQIGIELLEALAAAHAKGFVHRDIKPDNVFLAQDGRGGVVVKLLDFGIASLATVDAADKLTRTGAVLGTPSYMSPEQAQGAQIDARSDLWSVGALLYRALAGALPYAGDTYNALIVSIVTKQHVPLEHSRPDLPRDMLAVVEHAMQKAPDARFQTAQEMCEALKIVNFDQHAHLNREPPDAVSRVTELSAAEAAQSEFAAAGGAGRHGRAEVPASAAEGAQSELAAAGGAGKRQGRAEVLASAVEATGGEFAAARGVGHGQGGAEVLASAVAAPRVDGSAVVRRPEPARARAAAGAQSTPRPMLPRVLVAAGLCLGLATAAFALRSKHGATRDAAAQLPAPVEVSAVDREQQTQGGDVGQPRERQVMLVDEAASARAQTASPLMAADTPTRGIAAAKAEAARALPQATLRASDERAVPQPVAMRGEDARDLPPTAAAAAAHAPAGLPREVLANVLAQHEAEFQHCLEEAVVAQMLAGAQRAEPLRLDVELSVAASGRVDRVELQGRAPADLTRCVRTRLMEAQFPRAEAPTTFRYPLVLAATIVGQ